MFRYNAAHLRTRNPIERVFGQLKSRFYMLGCRIRLKLSNIPPFIMACFVLHNIAKRMRVPDFHAQPVAEMEESSEEEEQESSSDSEDETVVEGQRAAVAFADRYFFEE